MRTLIPELADGLAPHLDLPFAFFGHSLGALLAYELAQHLRRTGGPVPGMLFLSSAAAPQLPRRRVAHLPDQEFIGEIRAYGGARGWDEPGVAETFMPVLRADFELYESYQVASEPPPGCPVLLYGGDQDERVTPAQLGAWRRLLPVQSLQLFPGGHFYLHDQRAALTASVARTLEALTPAPEAVELLGGAR